MNWWGFLMYTAVMAFTPGPNNLVALDTARRVGLRHTGPLLKGLALGFLVIDAAVILTVMVLGGWIHGAEPWLKSLGAVYLLYLAATMLRPATHHGTGTPADGSLFSRGLLVNLTNVKVMLFFLVGVTGYLIPGTGSLSAAAVGSFVMPLTCCVSNLVWAQAGSLLSAWLARHRRGADLTIALLLAGCAGTLWL